MRWQKRPRRRRPRVSWSRPESLEPRTMLAADIVSGVLTVTGTPSGDTIEIEIEGVGRLVNPVAAE